MVLNFFSKTGYFNVSDSNQTTNISHLVKKRKKSESEAEAASGAAENGDLAKKPHVEAVASNGNGHTNGN